MPQQKGSLGTFDPHSVCAQTFRLLDSLPLPLPLEKEQLTNQQLNSFRDLFMGDKSKSLKGELWFFFGRVSLHKHTQKINKTESLKSGEGKVAEE